MKHDDPNLIVRYTANERSNHWITAISFVLLALSGLALFHPSMFWMTALFGGGQWTRILHPFVGLVMFVSFAVMVVRYWRHNLLDASDRRWLRQMDDVLANREDKLPEAGRYNAGQKLLFFVMVASLLLLLVSGIVIWRRYFSLYFPIGAIRAAAVVHAAAAFALIVGIVVHVYAALWVKGSIGAMVRGTVTVGWARKHHPKWFRESVK
ncbi:formate dehydrogenase, gamma subunit [Burkholderia thailandensis USAMRU Malaysia |uniref:Formate dehydrogenase, gamma subunit n=1 Tax=Burkholderia thailandensis (strain ATCC 700388 / DSM 13276 / CCUG 48851 / CIP 106301 / E264) TaxID=271848 RepID=Q2T7E1_BURTA|nr:formate dehydrogenase subunit gamma [Burkholderia thailandensis]ABC34556.1 formate dehydrogenase, gamma subunit [Burkholderia thailandensis E264]AHI75260.1 formate dehydrogenase, gamma subunit [Burkholderia thailandensis 2002721723]AHI82790.1 formate dehydrogenase, gamma subunit [Burkholderia thailandensis E444]AIC90237.1 formate dehydrogenase, gamma subunit [Burkholderia thailandensis USAMRU Malaysia \